MNQTTLAEEVAMLRSLAVSLVGRDSEGAYRQEFVRKALRAARLVPTRRFLNKKTFLAELSKNA